MHGVPGDRVRSDRASVPLYVAKNPKSQSDGPRVGAKDTEPTWAQRELDERASGRIFLSLMVASRVRVFGPVNSSQNAVLLGMQTSRIPFELWASQEP